MDSDYIMGVYDVCVCSDVLEVLLDPPQRVGTLPQLGHFCICQTHVDHTAHTAAVQHTRQGEEDLLTNAIHVLGKYKHTHTVRQRNKQHLYNCVYNPHY